MRRFGFFIFYSLIAVAAWTAPAPIAHGQEADPFAGGEEEASPFSENIPTDGPLWKGPPFDRIWIKDADAPLVVEPIDVNGERRPSEPKPSTQIDVRLLEDPEREFKVTWRYIERLQLFEELLLQRAAEHVKQEEFNEAFDYYQYLLDKSPKSPGLKQAILDYLFANVRFMVTQKRFDAALGILEELYARDPDYHPALAASLGRIFDQIIEQYMAEEDWRTVRGIIARIGKQYPSALASTQKYWEDRLSSIAADHRDAAVSHKDNKDFLQAHASLREMRKVWPSVPRGRETAEQIIREYPLVAVGVTELPTAFDVRSLASDSARRAGRLRSRLLSEFQGHGPEGGKYTCPVGEILRSDDDLQLLVRLSTDYVRSGTQMVTGYDLATQLLARATPGDPSYLSAWGQLVNQIAVERVMQVRIDFRRPHVLPESLLQSPLDPSSSSETFGSYEVAKKLEGEFQYTINESHPLTQLGQPAVVIERKYNTGASAVDSLLTGDIDVLDRVPHADLRRLQSDPAIQINPYSAPTVHLLVPNTNKPYTANRTFRRAILFGVARQAILDTIVLGGEQVPGCQVLSGPFPAGVRPNDPMAYATNERIAPRLYDPVQASVLKVLAVNELKSAAEKAKEKPPKLTPLVLGHAPTEMARKVCQAIEFQLNKVDIPCKLKELPAETFDDLRGWPSAKSAENGAEGAEAGPGDFLKDDVDLVYIEAALWDPIVDARRLLGEQGIAGADNPYIRLALREIDSAKNWREARNQLLDLHRLVQTELVVIPLWQTVNYMAYRRGLENVPQRPVVLYDAIEQWRIDPTARPYD